MVDKELDPIVEEKAEKQSGTFLAEEKATFYVRTETVDLLEYSVIDLRRMGNREDRGRINKSLIVDAAINIVCNDLKEKGESSMLATRLLNQDLKHDLQRNKSKKNQVGLFYKNVLGKSWSFDKKQDGTKETGIEIKTKFRFAEVSFDIHNKDGSVARYKENRKSIIDGGNVVHYKKHHVNLEYRCILADNEPTPDLTGLTRVVLNLHNEPNLGHIVLPEKGLVAYVETVHIKELDNAVYVAWLTSEQVTDIGGKEIIKKFTSHIDKRIDEILSNKENV